MDEATLGARMKLQAELGERSYAVWIEQGVSNLPSAVSAALGAASSRGPSALIADRKAKEIHGERFEQALAGAGYKPVVTVEVEPGEPSKTLTRYGAILETMANAALDRSSPVFALGGGVTGDLAGFVAATFLRGVPLVQLPTTLLAQVDSSLGGKTGVNLPAGKNLVGAFWQPKLVYADVSTLDTLPPRELAAGLAEVVKYGVIGDASILTLLETKPLSAELLSQVVSSSAAIKLRLVEEDERESAGGRRALLNFGHTVGHAIEAATGYTRFLHGEAVGLGMLAAARVSAARGGDRGLEKRLAALLSRLSLPTDVDTYLTEPVLHRIKVDKKRRGSQIRFVIAREAGQAETVLLKPEEISKILLP